MKPMRRQVKDITFFQNDFIYICFVKVWKIFGKIGVVWMIVAVRVVMLVRRSRLL